MNVKNIVSAIPHEYRKKILLEWMPTVLISWRNDSFKLLWEAYFVYVEPNAVRKDDCPICWSNVIKNWANLVPFLIEAEQEYNALENL